MAHQEIRMRNGDTTLSFFDISIHNKMVIEMSDGSFDYNSIFLDKEEVISLREHLDYIISKLTLLTKHEK